MKTIIGKYIIYEDPEKLSVKFRYTFSDVIGGFWLLLMAIIGTLIFYSFANKFKIDSIKDWLFTIIGIVMFGYGTFFLFAGLYNPVKGIFRIDKLKGKITIADILKSETIDISNVSGAFYTIHENYRPKMKYVMISLRLTDGETKDCFIIRSSIPFDLGRKVDKDLHTVTRKVRDRINYTLAAQKIN